MGFSILLYLSTRLILGTCFSISSLLGTLGNFVSLYCLRKTKKSEEKLNNSALLILTLNLSDLVNCMVIAPFQAAYTINLYPGTHPIHLVQIYLAALASWYPAIVMFLIAIHRYIQINLSIHYQSFFKNYRMAFSILICLVFCVLSPSLMFTGSFTAITVINEVVIFTSMVLIPIFYVLIYRNMRKSHRRARGTSQSTTVSTVSRNVLILISIFLICRFPGFMSGLVYLMAKNNRTIDHLFMARIGMLFSTVNSCVNPFAYVFMDQSYRNTLRKMCGKKNRSTKIGSSTCTGTKSEDENVIVIDL
ncbi:probable G-protein coupled receptor 34 [Clytia hemisphaerica]|uniref:probable G-protein coupled receptor 34 n=1 Tax=Clytia hemisphaerica TaxID=252671 RepID=UPI0034D4013D